MSGGMDRRLHLTDLCWEKGGNWGGGERHRGKNFGSLNVLMSISEVPKKRPITKLITQLELE